MGVGDVAEGHRLVDEFVVYGDVGLHGVLLFSLILPPYLREVAHDAGVLFVQVVAFGFVGDELVQLGDEACGVARA